MCGISGIVSKTTLWDPCEKIVLMNQAIRHRGPDGEGYMLGNPDLCTPYFHRNAPDYQRSDLNYIPKAPLPQQHPAKLAFGHRRLAIIDLSETGHQPMCSEDGKSWIVFNGEIYNYLELRKELENLGQSFVSQSDTEVILKAYAQWGQDCVKRFNGMWSFCIYDRASNSCFASRDRLGVKPFYYIHTKDVFAFASEQKAFVKAGLLKAAINEKALYNYLVNDLLETETTNFFEGVNELWPGHNLTYSLSGGQLNVVQYYRIQPDGSNDQLDEKTLIERISQSFERSVQLRLRSDVEVGTCLSGGIDSSALAVTMAEMTGRPIHCFTSVFRDQPFNEEVFADIVAKKIGAKYHKTEPSLEGLQSEIDDLVYSQDVPIWSTSTYAQFKVMELSKMAGIKVVLDGQGADELFGGYHHHFVAKWDQLFSQGRYAEAFSEIRESGKTIPSPFVFYMKEKLKQRVPVRRKQLSGLLTPEYLSSGQAENPSRYFNDLNQQLLDDIERTRLKTFLKCEDRCGMWHGVESRTPFSDDIDLISLLFSFDGNKKIKHGISKYLLREAVKDKLPAEIYSRYDKKGFQTPMRDWIKQWRPALLEEIRSANFSFVDKKAISSYELNNLVQYETFFKLFILSRWRNVFKG